MKSEHAMGYIQSRFCSLWGLQQQIDDIHDHGWALVWVKTYIVLHALISIIEEGDKDMEYVAELVQEGRDYEELHGTSRLECRDGLSDAQQQVGGRAKRSQLKCILLEYLNI
jgi:hypothetical protein